ncbi:hypothetical protein HXX76_012815 [Chlamydomonas incerta]|uniref:S-adenosyl-L-methionine-dependent methyltransferase n=1 Tax=Chlamydomonas incerta TaxID=51695 RepID=A0A835SGG3_CHLIN|nr:hypothetical protein HXX76_012815 [Chlamydomonas incerta]|eukprot:KAG2426758.1 hypothetical protein HXX76_012815 [Chlamydomonas incerta]
MSRTAAAPPTIEAGGGGGAQLAGAAAVPASSVLTAASNYDGGAATAAPTPSTATTAAGAPTSTAASPAAKASAGATASAAAAGTAGSSKLGLLYAVTRGQPTNYDMLVFRTLNRELGRPNANADTLAARLRDELMPRRSWLLKHLPGSRAQLRRTLENPLWGVPGAVNFIDARTKWFDGAVTEALADGIQQVVIVAAGYDTRAYRLGAPGVRFFEVDLPAASSAKKALVEKLKFVEDPARLPTFVAADLSRVSLAEALAGTAFEPSQRTLFTVEGLIYYLPQAAAGGLLAALSGLAVPGSRVYFDFMSLDALEGRGKFPGFKVTRKSVANKGEPFLSGIGPSREAVAAALAPHGLGLRAFLAPKDMVGLMLPHESWSDSSPPIASFYYYAAADK